LPTCEETGFGRLCRGGGFGGDRSLQYTGSAWSLGSAATDDEPFIRIHIENRNHYREWQTGRDDEVNGCGCVANTIALNFIPGFLRRRQAVSSLGHFRARRYFHLVFAPR